MQLTLRRPKFYRVKKGQTLSHIAAVFCLPPALLAQENGLKEDVCEGEVLRLPPPRGNLYRVQGGESKSLLCGSPRAFEEENGTATFYPGQTVCLSEAHPPRPPHTIE